ncbi:hypothetical protein [Streptomyces sp. NPDC002537]
MSMRNVGRAANRSSMIDLRASAMMGNVLAAALALGVFYEACHGRFDGPFSWLSVLGGGTYAASSIAYTRAGHGPTEDGRGR